MPRDEQATYQAGSHHVVDVWTGVNLSLEDEPSTGDCRPRPIGPYVTAVYHEEVGWVCMRHDKLEAGAEVEQVSEGDSALEDSLCVDSCGAGGWEGGKGFSPTYSFSWAWP
jgi:hypothetical protein